MLEGRSKKLDSRFRFQVIKDRETGEFLVWDTDQAKAIQGFKNQSYANNLKNKMNK